VHIFEKLDAVSIVDLHSDEHWAGGIEGFVQRWRNFIGVLDAKTGCAERLGDSPSSLRAAKTRA
jgi:hypothetical protein